LSSGTGTAPSAEAALMLGEPTGSSGSESLYGIAAASSWDNTTHPWNFSSATEELNAGFRATGSTLNSPVGSPGANGGWEERRTHILSNGQILWDISGNAAEWVRMTCEGSGDTTGSYCPFVSTVAQTMSVNTNSICELWKQNPKRLARTARTAKQSLRSADE
jgi:hypothetical protein